MKIPRLELALLFDNAIIIGLLTYISTPEWLYALLTGVFTFILQVVAYLTLRKFFRPKAVKQ